MLYVYDITSLESFNKINEWFNKLPKKDQYFSIILVGNKSDLEKDRRVSKDEGMQLAKKFNAEFFETNAYDSKSIENLFKAMYNILKGKGLFDELLKYVEIPSERKIEKYESHRQECKCYHF